MKTEDDLVLPSNHALEAILLGSVIGASDLEYAQRVTETLHLDDFNLGRHRNLFSAISALSAAGIAPKTHAVYLELKKQEHLWNGALAFLSELSSTAALANVESHCESLKKLTTLRSALVSIELLQKQIMSGDTTGDLVSHAEQLVQLLNRDQTANESLQTPDEIISAAGGVNRFFASETVDGIATPFQDLNDTIVGIQPQQLFILAARPAVGKSALGMQIAVNAALGLGKRVVVYSLEMSSRSLLRRAVIARSGVSGMAARRGELTRDQFDRLARALQDFQQLTEFRTLLFSQGAHVSTSMITSDLRRLAARGTPAHLVVLDYLQLCSAVGRHENRVQEISQISRGLKIIAKEHCPVLALSQLSRAIESRGDGRPVLSDLRESGSIEQDADVVMFLWPKDKIDNPDSEIKNVNWAIAKQREGPTNEGTFYFHRKTARFEESAGVAA